MISITKKSGHFHLHEDWLEARWHFSFGHYHDARNMGWGKLRVFNDDIIAPGGKFGMHPHANYEIMTVVLDGELTHQDSAGHSGKIGLFCVQAMSAGSGVFHSEENAGKKPVHSLQIWIEPKEKGGKAAWKSHAFKPSDFENTLCPLVSGNREAPLSIRQDATVYRSILKKGVSIEYSPTHAHQYVCVVSGALKLNGQVLRPGDSARVRNEKVLSLSAESGADFILLSMP